MSNESINFIDLPIEEQKDYFIQQLSGHEREIEITSILSTLTALNIDDSVYIELYWELVDEEIKEIITSGLGGADWEEEDKAWQAVIKSLGAETVLYIFDNYMKVIRRYLNVENLADDFRRQLYEKFFNPLELR